jgi:hypothetical protein
LGGFSLLHIENPLSFIHKHRPLNGNRTMVLAPIMPKPIKGDIHGWVYWVKEARFPTEFSLFITATTLDDPLSGCIFQWGFAFFSGEW